MSAECLVASLYYDGQRGRERTLGEGGRKVVRGTGGMRVSWGSSGLKACCMRSSKVWERPRPGGKSLRRVGSALASRFFLLCRL